MCQIGTNHTNKQATNKQDVFRNIPWNILLCLLVWEIYTEQIEYKKTFLQTWTILLHFIAQMREQLR